jgi:hypothetical protein
MENLELFLEENITYIFDNAKHIAWNTLLLKGKGKKGKKWKK